MFASRKWEIQLVVCACADEHDGNPRYLSWAVCTLPMTGDQAVFALRESELRWPEYEFRAHRIDDDGRRFVMFRASVGHGHAMGLS